MSRVAPLIATVLLVLLAPEEAVAAGRWRRPLPGGAIAQPFTYERSAPFAGGRRRGIDVAAAPGVPVGAVCGGVVAHAGRVPRFGRGVTVRCADGLVATELGLGALAVGRGARVVPGTTLGRLAASGVLRVGARRAGDRFGYVDPAPLFGDEQEAPPAVAPPPAGPRRRGAWRAARGPRPAVVHRPTFVPRTDPAPARPPLPILLGVGLLAAGASGGLVRRRRARRRWAPEPAVVQR